MNTALVVFAIREEFAPWRRCHRFRSVAGLPYPASVAGVGSTQVYATLMGAGSRAAGRIADLTRQVAPSLAIVTGVAAGLRPEWRSGDMLVAREVRSEDEGTGIAADGHLLECALRCGAKPASTLITVPHVLRSVKEKACLAGVADAADMESLPLMQHWSANGVPALALRVILDPVDMPMTCDFEAAMDAHGQIRRRRLAAQLLRQPRLLPGFVHLARRSRHCLGILARFLDNLFAQLALVEVSEPEP